MTRISIKTRNRSYLSVGLVALVALLSSCGSTKVASIDAAYVYSNGFMMAKPIVVDISVEKRKIEGRAVIKNKLYGAELAVKAAKSLAVIDAVKRGDADIIVQPMYEIETVGKYTTATVTGYAGKYKEFRQAAVTDTLAFNMRQGYGTAVPDYVAPGEVTVTQKSKIGIIIGGVIVLGLLISLII